MKQSIWAALLLSGAMMATTAWAKSDVAIIQEAKTNVVTVAQAHKMKDKTGVTLTGQIVRQITLHEDDFEFRDKTGSIVLDIDDDLWEPLNLKAGDKVRVIGEVDTHIKKPTEIEVVRIERIK
ncbi:DNA-binding protein [Acinetobacter sp. NCu2D-2]|uniref:NirD/YgiW/YdeI family stress tolerance protein n=1 Tax=Acinetobacter sp. NCu2D-2 TaxID=1608473 RepID=UPI0007CDA6E5|nr:NirD/YgiW/YdeI family stress tolerance protein [Acinetobacter sp. NCu2D-2]ANF82848.1 DNA-binding protein [Acinetobacter sp. NCu2D-2]